MWNKVFWQQLMLTRRFVVLYGISFVFVFLLTLGIYFSSTPTTNGLVVLLFPKFNLFIGIFLISSILTLITTSKYRQEIYITKVRKVVLIENIIRIMISETILMGAWLIANLIGLMKSNLVENIFQNLDQWILRVVYLFIAINVIALTTFLGELIFKKRYLHLLF